MSDSSHTLCKIEDPSTLNKPNTSNSHAADRAHDLWKTILGSGHLLLAGVGKIWGCGFFLTGGKLNMAIFLFFLHNRLRLLY